MKTNENYKEIKEFISKGDLDTAIKKLKSLNKFEDIDSVSARFNLLEKNNTKGTLSHSEYTLEYNKITDALLSIVNNPANAKPKSKFKLSYIIIGVLLALGIVFTILQFLPEEK